MNHPRIHRMSTVLITDFQVSLRSTIHLFAFFCSLSHLFAASRKLVLLNSNLFKIDMFVEKLAAKGTWRGWNHFVCIWFISLIVGILWATSHHVFHSDPIHHFPILLRSIQRVYPIHVVNVWKSLKLEGRSSPVKMALIWPLILNFPIMSQLVQFMQSLLDLRIHAIFGRSLFVAFRVKIRVWVWVCIFCHTSGARSDNSLHFDRICVNMGQSTPMTFKKWLSVVVQILFIVFWIAILDTRRPLNLYLLTAISFKRLLRCWLNDQLCRSLVDYPSHGRMLRRFQSTDLFQVYRSFPVGVTSPFIAILYGPFCLENRFTSVHTLFLSGRKYLIISVWMWLITAPLLSLI